MNIQLGALDSRATKPKTGAHIGVIGGGVAGSTTALHLAQQGYKVTLIEQGDSLVSGPPICHLHAGGNLYREISDNQCFELLKDSIDTLKLFPHTINRRPTVLATPLQDTQPPTQLLSRLKQVQHYYQQLIDQDPSNKVLGEPADYYKLYSHEQLKALASESCVEIPTTIDQWLVPFAKHADLNKLQYPVIAVQEYGWSVFRLSAQAQLELEQQPLCETKLSTKVVDVALQADNRWTVYIDNKGSTSAISVDYLVNACGFRSGELDNLANVERNRLVEFKAAYLARWHDNNEQWPEVIFHGQRGTPQGMAQLTPYGKTLYQLHGMTESITLFKDGLVAAKDDAQPKLPQRFIDKIEQGWQQEITQTRTQAAIEHMAQFIPSFANAELGGKPLFGAQQIPGNDVSLRATSISFSETNYACIETVKASSCLPAAVKLVEQLKALKLEPYALQSMSMQNSQSLSFDSIEQTAQRLASSRGYPIELASYYGE